MDRYGRQPGKDGGTDFLSYQDVVGGSLPSIVTRVLLNRSDFSRVIGSSGANITRIREKTTGAVIRASDTEIDDKIIILDGRPRDVKRAFEMIIDTLDWGGTVGTIRVALESFHAGKVLGSKGSTIKNMQSRSRATFIKMANDPIDVSGVSMRVVTFEGQSGSVITAHQMFHEILWGEEIFSGSGGSGGNGNSSSGIGGVGAGSGPGQYQPQYATVPVPVTAPAPPVMTTVMAPFDFDQLTTLGLGVETVTQLKSMRSYLQQNFNLKLEILQPTLQPAPQQQQPPQQQPAYTRPPGAALVERIAVDVAVAAAVVIAGGTGTGAVEVGAERGTETGTGVEGVIVIVIVTGTGTRTQRAGRSWPSGCPGISSNLSSARTARASRILAGSTSAACSLTATSSLTVRASSTSSPSRTRARRVKRQEHHRQRIQNLLAIAAEGTTMTETGRD